MPHGRPDAVDRGFLLAHHGPTGRGVPEARGPPLNEITWTVLDDWDEALYRVVKGELDVLMWSKPMGAYERLSDEELAKLVFVKCVSAVWFLEFNSAGSIEPNPHPKSPVLNETGYPGIVIVSDGEGRPFRSDGVYFNPFAIREIRFALNFLINRSYLVGAVLHGSGAPMFSAVQPSHPANGSFWPIYEEYGLTVGGDPAKSADMVKQALLDVLATWESMGAPYDLRGGLLKDVRGGGDWLEFYDGTDWKPVELNFFIRTEDERLDEGRYIADLIEAYWKIKVKRLEYDRAVCIPIVYGTDPLAYQWDLYTAGWVSSPKGDWAYPDEDLVWYYWLCPLLGFPYGVLNETVYTTGLRLYSGAYGTADEYWELCRQLCRYGIYEAHRIAIAEVWGYFPVNKDRAHDIAFGRMTGLWSPWSFRTAETPDGVLRVAGYSPADVLFTSAWNPVGGFRRDYSARIWQDIHDYGAMTGPWTGLYLPARATWKVEKDCYFDRASMAWAGRIDVPPDAIFYNHTAHAWQTVGPGRKACVRVMVNYRFGNWHHGIPMDISDVLAVIGFYWEWAYKDPGEGRDHYYHRFYSPWIEEQYRAKLELLKGIRILNDTALEFYGDYLFPPDDDVTAASYIWWPTVPWEVRTVMEYCVVNGGPLTGRSYDWSGDLVYCKDGWISMIDPDHVRDFLAAAERINNEELRSWFKPRYVILAGTPYAEHTPPDGECHERWEALLNWTNAYGHICISNGPYWLESWDPEGQNLVLKGFRDPTYPFTPDHWLSMLSGECVANPTPAPGGALRPGGWPWASSITIALASVLASTSLFYVLLRWRGSRFGRGPG